MVLIVVVLAEYCMECQLTTMNKTQQVFLEQLGERIPRLFHAIAQGNVKSEFIVGVRTINSRQVRLKLVAEVVDPGSNPLATHGQIQPRTPGGQEAEGVDPDAS